MTDTVHPRRLSLYLHIPFCVRKCYYCDFLSAPANEAQRQEYTELLCREIAAWGELLRHRGESLSEWYEVETIFIGGGTPSCLFPKQLERIGEAVFRSFQVRENAEFTVEANPGTVEKRHAQGLRRMGVNRVSLGLQSAQDEELARLGRIHTYGDFLQTYHLLRESGFRNINVDLMSDIPGQTPASYEDTLNKIVSLAPEHISAYSLIVEPGTPFYEWEQQGMLELQDEESERKMYEFTGNFLAECGYRRYEISNYARQGFACRHNTVYWQCGEYLGMGLGASSCLGGYRFACPVDAKSYWEYVSGLLLERTGGEENWEAVLKRSSLCDVVKLSRKMQMEEFLFLGLRMREGVSEETFFRRFGKELREVYKGTLERLLAEKLLAEEEFSDRIYLTDRGIDVSNRVLAEFLLD